MVFDMDVTSKLTELFSLVGKVVLLTGASGGIGEELAVGLAQSGGKMALCDIQTEKVNTLSQKIVSFGGKSISYSLDVADLRSIHECVEQVIADYGMIDVLINCAGINKREGLLDVEESTYDKIMDINFKGAYFLSQAVAKHMIKARRGNIINIASHNSVGMLGGCSVYGASKSAIVAMTRSLAIELAQYGIRANALAPGHISTELTIPLWSDPVKTAYLEERIAMERAGTPEELVGIIVMLASDASSYMSGATIHVDGGCLAGGKPWPYDTAYS